MDAGQQDTKKVMNINYENSAGAGEMQKL